MTASTIALLVAAGKSERTQTELPKPYLLLGGEPLLRRSVKTFLNQPGIDGVRVVIRREHHMYYKKSVDGLTLFPCVIGGETRQESVRRGLESLIHRKPKYVLVHDIARPFASPMLIARMLAAVRQHRSAIPALPVFDTLKRACPRGLLQTVDREAIYTAQTPQAFDYETLLEAHRRFADQNHTDDAALMEKAGVPVALVEGDADNVKITAKKDITRMESMIAMHSETRTGMGFDVHPLKKHDPETPVSQQIIKLCGAKIPFTHFLEGHSDADVGLHALVDAMLGAMSAGDIGMHFPPDDRKWQGAESERFVLYAYEMLKGRGGELLHLDITLICERPRISEYRQQMAAHLAQLLKLDSSRVSIKATTTERLGFTGRGEGIAAQAVVTIRVPHHA